MKPESYCLCSPIKGLLKSYSLMATEGNVSMPLVILKRPKWITSDEAWKDIITSLSLCLPKGYEIK